MNSGFKSIFFITVIIFFTIFISGCEKAEEDNPDYSFEVISSAGTFVGYYKVDGGAAKEFSGSPMGESLIYYSCEKRLDAPISVLVSATGAGSATSVSIYIYEKNVLAQSVTVSQTTTGVPVTATLSYTFDSASSE